MVAEFYPRGSGNTDIEFLEQELEVWLAKAADPTTFLAHEHYVRTLLQRAINTPAVYPLATRLLDVCLRNLHWHERFPAWQMIVSDALTVAQDLQNEPLQASLYVHFGEFMRLQGQHKSAVQAANVALAHLLPEWDEVELDALLLLLRLQIQRGLEKPHKTYIRRALRLARMSGKPSRRMELCQVLGHIYCHAERFRRATRFTLFAFRLARLERIEARQVECLLLLAMIARRQNRLNRALTILKIAEPRLKTVSGYTQYAANVYELGSIAHLNKEHDKAATLVQEARQRFRALKMSHHEAASVQTLALIQIAKGDFESATENAQTARAMWDKLQYRYGICDVLITCAHLEIERGRRQRALVYLRRAEQQSKQIEDPALHRSLQTQIDYYRRKALEDLGADFAEQ